MNEFLTIIGLILLMSGVFAIYDARPLSKEKIFKGEQQNEIARAIKIIGFAIALVGATLIYSFFNIG